jgi:hypothetical protein
MPTRSNPSAPLQLTASSAPLQKAEAVAPTVRSNNPPAARSGHHLSALRVTAAGPVSPVQRSVAQVIQRNRYAGAIADREPNSGQRPVQGPLTLEAHRLLISRGLNVRSRNLYTFERAARRLARERRADDALLEESRAQLSDPGSATARLHLALRQALATKSGKQLAEVPDDIVSSLYSASRLAKSGHREVIAMRADPLTGAPTHPTKEGAFFEDDPGHQALAALGLSSQSGTSGSAADIVRGAAALLGPQALQGREAELTRLTHLYMRDERFHGVIGTAVQSVKNDRGLEQPSAEDAAALPSSHTHSLGEIAQGVHLQTGILGGTITPGHIDMGHYFQGGKLGLSLLAGALARKRARLQALRQAQLAAKPLRAKL